MAKKLGVCDLEPGTMAVTVSGVICFCLESNGMKPKTAKSLFAVLSNGSQQVASAPQLDQQYSQLRDVEIGYNPSSEVWVKSEVLKHWKIDIPDLKNLARARKS